MIAALYVEKGGVYYGLPDVDPWDEERDARLYDGPWPVVAHPPCARWCRLAGFVEHVHGHKRGDDGGTFAAALDAVRRFGGVLEHPAYSDAWAHFGLHRPEREGWTFSLLDEGVTAYVEQGRYGMLAKKATWLYACGVELPDLRWGYTPDAEGEPGSNAGGNGGMDAWRDRWTSGWWINPDDRRPAATRLRRENSSHTPTAFRDVLLNMARSVRSNERGRSNTA